MGGNQVGHGVGEDGAGDSAPKASGACTARTQLQQPETHQDKPRATSGQWGLHRSTPQSACNPTS
eukprot:2054680-Alexandrium_andersonii.AAC.1